MGIPVRYIGVAHSTESKAQVGAIGFWPVKSIVGTALPIATFTRARFDQPNAVAVASSTPKAAKSPGLIPKSKGNIVSK